jgi:YidC/Oxa1 family membrane protein insertase
MDTRTIIAFALMILIYMFFFQPSQTSSQREVGVSNAIVVPVQTEKQMTVEPQSAKASVQNDELSKKLFWLFNNHLRLEVDAFGSVRQAEFLSYKQAVKNPDPVRVEFASRPFNETVIATGAGVPVWKLERVTDTEIRLRGHTQDLNFVRNISLAPDSYIVTISDEIENHGKQTAKANLKVQLSYPPVSEPIPTSFVDRVFRPQAEVREAVYDLDGSVTRLPFQKISGLSEKPGAITWTGFSQKHFFFGVIGKNISGVSLAQEKMGDAAIVQRLSLSEKVLAPSEKTDCTYQFFIGPKVIAELERAGPELREVVDYGSWLGPIARLLLSILHFFYQIIPNYGVGIILLTILVKLALFPLAYKSAISMRKLQLVQPKMKEIRDKYKEDKQRMNAEMMALYRTEKVNPVGGCLPILLQMPVFFALYRVFYASIEFRLAPFAGWVNDLSAHDPYFVTPVLMTALMWYQTKLTPQPPALDESEAVQAQRAMMKWMPIVFGAIMVFLPSGLTLYFLINALISLIQQVYLNKHMQTHFPLASFAKSP